MKKIAVASLLFSLAITLIRLFILSFYGTDTGSYQITGVLIGVVNEFAIGFLITYAFAATLNKRLSSVLVFLFFSIVVLLKITGFHYEAVFGHLPGAGILYYLSELRNLDSSIRVNLPVIAVIAEFIAVILIYLVPLAIMLRTEKSSSSNYIWGTPAILAIIVSMMVQMNVIAVPDKYYKQSRESITWLIKSNFRKNVYQADNLEITENEILNFLRIHGFQNPGPAISNEFPICRINSIPNDKKSYAKNVILLILEGVGMDEMQGEYLSRQLMPRLQNIATENLSFDNFHASGSKSSHALISLFSGLPAHPFSMYLWIRPLLNFNAFPALLADQGYQTVFLHGGDLAFEHQRQYLAEAGFEQLVEYELDEDMNSLAWGYDDRTMFNKLKNWILNTVQTGSPPYLATLATLSTHDPYVLPEDWNAVFSEKPRTLAESLICCSIEGEKNTMTAAAETYRFLDEQIGDFYDWYRENTHDTLLVITGDHPPILDFFEENQKSYEHDFRVPFVIAGLDEKTRGRLAQFTHRRGSQYDVPATIMYLLGKQPHECNLGNNLFSAEQRWPGNRYLYAVAGDTLDYLQIWYGEQELIFDKPKGVIHVPRQGITRRPGDDRVLDYFLGTLFSVHTYLTKNNAYGFRETRLTGKESIPPVKSPLIVSHRGNINGTAGNPAENTEQAINSAISAGFKWIEVDVRLTADGIPVLLHDGEVVINGNKIPVSEVNLEDLKATREYHDIVRLDDFVNKFSGSVNMLIEIKPVNDISKSTRITREVARIINERSSGNRIIVDSFNDYLVFSIKNYCNCETALDLPFGKKPTIEELRHATRLGFDWIYVHHDVVNAGLIENAHDMGLRVMTYTVNDMDIISNWQREMLPDGIITDSVQILQYFDNKQ